MPPPGRTDRIRRRAVVLVLVLLLSGCTQSDQQSTPPKTVPDASTERVVGTWDLTGGRWRDRNIEPLRGLPVTLSADRGDGQDVWAGVAPCNWYGLDVAYRDDALVTGDLSSTLVGCRGARGRLERTYFRALRRVDRARATDDRLSLTGDGVRLEFSPTPAVPIEEVAGVRWTFVAARPPLPDHSPWRTTPSLRMWANAAETGGRFRQSLGCGRVTGRWTIWHGDLTVTSARARGQSRCRIAGTGADLNLGSPFRLRVEKDRLVVVTRADRTLVFTRARR